jgi:hypothetical protein
MSRTRILGVTGALLGIVLVAALAVVAFRDGGADGSSGSTTISQATSAELRAAGLDELPLAEASRRVDLAEPAFSNPTEITNPLFPIGTMRSAVLSGRVDGKDFKTETTLLPHTAVFEWPDGRTVETLVSQYVAYLDGRIEEVALDHYAQADDGSVWYFGEDVFNYEDGFIADTAGTWFAGIDGPAAMIMPADPQVGDVYRPENAPGQVFEEVRIATVGKAVAGPHGPVEGAVIASELHADGPRENKTFAPGYGEFFTASGGDVEAMSLAVPADELSGPVPDELATLSAGADDVFEAAGRQDWKAASGAVRRVAGAWEAFGAGDVPPRLAVRTTRALDGLARAVMARDPAQARHAALDVAQSSLDLQLRHRPPAEIDRARFELWARRLVLDAAADDAAGVRGDLATLEWTRDRFAHTLDKVAVARIDAHLLELRADVGDDDLRRAGAEAAALRKALAGRGAR